MDETPASARLLEILTSMEERIQARIPLAAMLEFLDTVRPEIMNYVLDSQPSVATAQLVTLKVLNICLAKYHYVAQSSNVLSRPFGLNLDPSNVCNLGCPGCVQSANAKELKVFEWDKGLLSESRMAALLRDYGPQALHVTFCNYGEPLVNAETPKFIRMAKTYLLGTMLSTNLSVSRFDADAYVESGLDFMTVSIDGATQATYEKFRKKGKLDIVHRNLAKLIEVKQRLGKKTPLIAWHFLAFEHNVHEIEQAREQAIQFGVNQFRTVQPFDVSWDDPNVHPANIDGALDILDKDSEQYMFDNWNPFPDNLDTEKIGRLYDDPWAGKRQNLPVGLEPSAAAAGGTCQWLYKKITMDAGGKVFPCCAAPQTGTDLVVARFEGDFGSDAFNSDKYKLSRLSFSDRTAYETERHARNLKPEPYCANCEWEKDTSATDQVVIRQYFLAAAGSLFSAASLNILAAW